MSQSSVVTFSERSWRISMLQPEVVVALLQDKSSAGRAVPGSVFLIVRLYYINATWPNVERARWEAYPQDTLARHSADRGEVSNDGNVPSLTRLEKKWLKDNYGDEFHFLRSYGLSIYKEEAREEGRRILRAMMGDDEDIAVHHSRDETGSDDREYSDEDEDDSDEEDSQGSFERDMEEDPGSHMADYHFPEKKLDWIRASYGHSGNFLMCYGLKFYNDEDCKEGVAIIRALTSNDVP
ncbi:MAG: hypothetical protein Q9168_003922 [Polycauliona sp. 1 TL-2023]